MDKKITSSADNNNAESLDWLNLSVDDIIKDLDDGPENAEKNLSRNNSNIFFSKQDPDNYDEKKDDYDPDDDFDEDLEDFDPDEFDENFDIDLDDIDIDEADIDDADIDETTIDYEDIEQQDEIEKEVEFDEDQRLDRIRERTFNEELSGLVTRIRANEQISEMTGTESEDTTPEDLLKKYHELFYKSINLPHLNQINTDYNPFNFINKLSDINPEEKIYQEMNSISLNKYSILTYNIHKRCFSPYINHINDINENNLVIDISEQLFTDILNNEYGIILNSDKICANVFYKKRFMPDDNKTMNFNLYFCSLNNFYSNLLSETGGITEEKASYYPLLIIKLEDKTATDCKSIYTELRNRLVHHFIMLEKDNSFIEATDIKDLHDLYSNIDYIYRTYYRRNEGICLNLKFSNPSKIEDMLILNYIKLKIQKLASKKTTISRSDINKLLIFVPKNEKKAIEQIIKELISLSNNTFTLDQFVNDDNRLSIILENCLTQ